MRGEEEVRALEARLGGRLPASIARLPAEALRELEAVVAEARRRQAAELHAAGERAYSHIPRLLRGPIRRIVG